MYKADVIITAAEVQHTLISSDKMKHALKERKNKPVCVLDLSVPRAVNPEIHDLNNVFLYDIDSLENVVTENMDTRQQEVTACLTIIAEQTQQFMNQCLQWDSEPLIAELNQSIDQIRQDEWERLLSKLEAADSIDDQLKQEIEYTTKRITNKIMHGPLTNIRYEVNNGRGYQILDVVRRLFWGDDAKK